MNDMKILLISNINSYKYGNTGIDYIVHYIREVKKETVDVRYYHHKESLEEIINDIPLDYDIYGLSVFETNYFTFKELCHFIKESCPKAIVAIGGQFVTMNYKEIIRDEFDADYYILGDGEGPFGRILEHHKTCDNLLENDENIATANSIEKKKANVEDHTIAEASFDYFEYDSFKNNRNKTHCMMTKSNVCTGACSFCCSRKGRIHYKENYKIIEEIKYLATEYGVRKFFFCDDDIFDIDREDNRKRLEDLLNGIENLNLNIVFSGFAKPKAVCNPQNYELLKKMSHVGFHHLFLGIDAGNESDRILYNKRSSLEEGISAVKIMNEVGISPRYGIIFINPYTSIETMRESFRYLLKLESSNYYHYGGLHVQLLNGTRLQKKVKEDGLLDPTYSFLNTEAYHYVHPEILPIIDFMEHEFIPQADAVKHQFNTLKRKYEMVKHMNREAEVLGEFVAKYEKIEFHNLKQFLYPLYEENDVNYCRNHLEEFIASMKKNALEYAPVIRQLNRLFLDTPLSKGEALCLK